MHVAADYLGVSVSRIIIGDCLTVLSTLESGSVQMCVTSPPYFGLRRYLPENHPDAAHEIGTEATPELYVAAMVDVFRLVRDALADDGTIWINIGDSYTPVNQGENARPRIETMTGIQVGNPHSDIRTKKESIRAIAAMGLKAKDLIGIPWMLAFALRADGWYLRQDIIWAKPNPMPESVRDRCTKSHEYIFLLSKSAKYYYDADAIAEPLSYSSIERLSQPRIGDQVGSDRVPGKTNGNMKAVFRASGTYNEDSGRNDGNRHPSGGYVTGAETRNKRSVWTVATQPYAEAHFATFPPDLIEPCILAGSKPGDMVLDPFGGSGTVGQVCESLGRQWLLIELNPAYAKLAAARTAQQGLQLSPKEVSA